MRKISRKIECRLDPKPDLSFLCRLTKRRGKQAQDGLQTISYAVLVEKMQRGWSKEGTKNTFMG